MTRMEELKLKIKLLENEAINRYIKETSGDLKKYKAELKELKRNEYKKS